MMKLLAIAVTYYPDEFARRNILAYIDSVDRLIVWENTPEKDREKYRIDLEEYQDKVEVMGDGLNHFIAYPLNRAAEYAITHGYTHILTMDQDSLFIDFAKYKEQICKLIDDPTICCYCANPNEKLSTEREITETLLPITSGSIYSLEAFKTIGYFREDYAIDAVDTEYSIRAKTKGFHTILLTNAHLLQEYGAPTKSKLGFISSNYSALRTYYIIRNQLYLRREYPDYFSIKELIVNIIVKGTIKVLLHEKNKFSKIWARVKGIHHGLTDPIKKSVEYEYFERMKTL